MPTAVLQQEHALVSPPHTPPWGLSKRIAFRTAFSYLVFYYLETIAGLLIPLFRAFGSPVGPRAIYRWPWNQLAGWTGVHVFSLDPTAITNEMNRGSTTSDTAINYITVGWMLLIAMAVAGVWSVLDRNRREYQTLNGWLRSFVRYALAMNLFAYGMPKVFPVQMLPVQLYTTQLLVPLGDKSPAGLLWAFMGYSIPYQMFSGAAEVLAGLLLLSRRTVTLGAFVSIAVLLNVVFLNFSYDVAVKLFSMNLLFAATFLVLPDVYKLVRLFCLEPGGRWTDRRGSSSHPTLATAGGVVFKVLLALFVYRAIDGAYTEFRLQTSIPARTPLYGIYEIDSFVRNGFDVPPLTTDRSRWKRLILESPQVVQVQLMDDSFQRYSAAHDTSARQITLSRDDGKGGYVLEYGQLNDDHLRVVGRAGGDVLTMTLRRIDPDKFLLRNRGFHWIQQRSLTR